MSKSQMDQHMDDVRLLAQEVLLTALLRRVAGNNGHTVAHIIHEAISHLPDAGKSENLTVRGAVSQLNHLGNTLIEEITPKSQVEDGVQKTIDKGY